MGNNKSGISRRAAFTAIVVTAFLQIAGHRAAAQPDPLPSWNDGAVKKSITDFVSRVTTPGSADCVPAEQRIATATRSSQSEAEACRRGFELQSPGQPWREAERPSGRPLMVQ
jgi:hypothetical protein